MMMVFFLIKQKESAQLLYGYMSRRTLIRAATSGDNNEFNKAWWETFPALTTKKGYAPMVDAYMATSFKTGVSFKLWQDVGVKINQCGYHFGLSETDIDEIMLAGTFARKMSSCPPHKRALLCDKIEAHLLCAGYTLQDCKVMVRAKAYYLNKLKGGVRQEDDQDLLKQGGGALGNEGGDGEGDEQSQ